ncbi:MAG: MFS transporter [Lachnospiraceae bacterium]|jgi:nitrate/nitrite transporter NarK|nr:MFS transporter [Lachnospiraceae bacterium]
MSEKTASKLKNNMGRLVILTTAGSLIYGLPYFRSYYYDAYLEVYHLTNTQMGTFGSIFGVLGAISYLFGGIVADMISPRMIMSVSLILTGAAGLLHLTNPSYGILVLIYLIWGFTSLFAFWPALLKGLRGLAAENEQSKAFGFMEGGRGIINALHLAITLAVFNFFSKTAGNLAGLNGVITFYSIVVILLGILTFLLMKNDKEQTKKGEKLSFRQVIDVLKMPAVWILSLILCCTYTMNISMFYFTPYATASFGITATAAAVVTMMAQYIRPISSIGGGILADRLGRSKMMFIGFIFMGISTAVLVLFKNVSIPLFIGLCILIYLAMYLNYGVVFSMMEEGGVPAHVAGTAIGVVCTLGYLPEVICPVLAGHVLDTYTELGYKYYFMGVAVVMFIGIIALILWNRYLKASRN